MVTTALFRVTWYTNPDLLGESPGFVQPTQMLTWLISLASRNTQCQHFSLATKRSVSQAFVQVVLSPRLVLSPSCLRLSLKLTCMLVLLYSQYEELEPENYNKKQPYVSTCTFRIDTISTVTFSFQNGLTFLSKIQRNTKHGKLDAFAFARSSSHKKFHYGKFNNCHLFEQKVMYYISQTVLYCQRPNAQQRYSGQNSF